MNNRQTEKEGVSNVQIINVKPLEFPPYAEFKRGYCLNILDYTITFGLEIRHTYDGLKGEVCFYVRGPKLPDYIGLAMAVNESNYQLAMKAIEESRINRILELMG